MKTTIAITFIIMMLFYIAGMTIKIKPFKISFDTPYSFFGAIFLIIAIGLLNHQSKLKGIEQGRNEIIELLKEISNKN